MTTTFAYQVEDRTVTFLVKLTCECAWVSAYVYVSVSVTMTVTVRTVFWLVDKQTDRRKTFNEPQVGMKSLPVAETSHFFSVNLRCSQNDNISISAS